MVTQDQVRKLLDYDQDTGVFTWRSFRNGRAVESAIAGCKGSGYVHIKIYGRSYLAHRLAWLYVHGEFPDCLIDHIDSDRSNNRISNLRKATFIGNGQNRKFKQSNNLSGFLGVYKANDSSKWKAQIRVNKKQVFLGSYDSPQEAHEAYLQAKRELHSFGMI